MADDNASQSLHLDDTSVIDTDVTPIAADAADAASVVGEEPKTTGEEERKSDSDTDDAAAAAAAPSSPSPSTVTAAGPPAGDDDHTEEEEGEEGEKQTDKGEEEGEEEEGEEEEVIPFDLPTPLYDDHTTDPHYLKADPANLVAKPYMQCVSPHYDNCPACRQAPMPGCYPMDAFTEELPEDLVCPCGGGLRDPIELPCGHVACQSCLLKSEILTCLVCNVPYDFSELQRPVKLIEAQVLKWPVRCPNTATPGCRWEGLLSKVHSHLLKCDHQVIWCPNKCGKQVVREGMPDHLERLCLRRLVACGWCSKEKTIEKRNLRVHLSVCGEYMINCPYACGVLMMRRKYMAEHLRMWEDPGPEGCCPNAPLRCVVEGCGAEVPRGELETHMGEGRHVRWLQEQVQSERAKTAVLEEQAKAHSTALEEQAKAHRSQFEELKSLVEGFAKELAETKADLTTTKADLTATKAELAAETTAREAAERALFEEDRSIGWTIAPHTARSVATLEGHTDYVTSVIHLSDGRIASGSSDKSIKIWKDGVCETTLNGHTDFVMSLTELPDGRLASGSRDNTVKLWNVTTGECEMTLEGHANNVYALAVLPDGDQLATGSYDHSIKVWSTETGECLYTLTGHSDTVYALVVLPDGRLASGSNDKTIKLWRGEECEATLTGHTDWVGALAVLPDGRLASCGGDQTVRLWRGEECVQVLRGHTNSVRALAVLPGGVLASGSYDKTVKVWDKDGTCVATLEGHTEYVFTLSASESGCLVSGSWDKALRVWGFSSPW